MSFDPENYLEKHEQWGMMPHRQGIHCCVDKGDGECLADLRFVLKHIKSELAERTGWLPFSYRPYFYGACREVPDCLYFCITNEPIRNMHQPLDRLQGSIMPHWFYERIHIVQHSYMLFKIVSLHERVIRCSIYCKEHKEIIRYMLCEHPDYIEYLDRSLMLYVQNAFLV